MERYAEEAIVVEGKNAEEALQAACDRLNTTPNQVEYEIIEESAKSGVLGFFKGKGVKIRVWQKSASERMIAEIVAKLFSKMGLQVTQRISRVDDAYEIDLQTEDSDGLLIGRGGETLKALQHLVSRMVGHRDEMLRVRLDVAGYRKRRQDQLRRRARDLADRAVSMHRDALTEPLPADERRIVHLALAEDTRVETHAIGEGQIKRVAVRQSSSRRGGSDAADGGSAERRGRRGPGRSSFGGTQGGGSGGARSSQSRRPGSGYSRGGRAQPTRVASLGSREQREPTGEEIRDPSSSGSEEQVVPGFRTESGADQWGSLKREGEGESGSTGGESTSVGGREEESPTEPESSRDDQPEALRPEEVGAEKAASSYFQIPTSVGGADRKKEDSSQDADDDSGSAAPMTWGRRRRPSRGRR